MKIFYTYIHIDITKTHVITETYPQPPLKNV